MEGAFAFCYGSLLVFLTLKFIDFAFCLDSLFFCLKVLVCGSENSTYK
jgi:hypothetical protein